jgi:hypothetical protein
MAYSGRLDVVDLSDTDVFTMTESYKKPRYSTTDDLYHEYPDLEINRKILKNSPFFFAQKVSNDLVQLHHYGTEQVVGEWKIDPANPEPIPDFSYKQSSPWGDDGALLEAEVGG